MTSEAKQKPRCAPGISRISSAGLWYILPRMEPVGEREERATAGVLVKFRPSELVRIDRQAHAAKASRGGFIKQWMAQVCESLEKKEA